MLVVTQRSADSQAPVSSDHEETARQRRRLSEHLLWALTDPSEPGWQRPGPTRTDLRADAVGAAALIGLALLVLALLESFAGAAEDRPRWLGYVMLSVQILPLAVRRRWPEAVFVLSCVLYVTVYYVTPLAAGQSGSVLGLYVAVYTLVAWGRSRQVVRLLVALLLMMVMVWVAIDLAITGSYAQMVESMDSSSGPFEPMTAFSVYSYVLNALGFGVAVFLGSTAWRSALRAHHNAVQAEQIRAQSQRLAEQAVLDERLRIARELHDVIAHHVSAIGIQAGAARKVLTRDVELAQEALRTVEDSSRQAVAETRQLLGVLRDDGSAEGAGPARTAAALAADSPEPRLEDVEELVAEHARRGLAVTLTWAGGAEEVLADVPPALGLSLYRCLQEALSNVVRHSTATSAGVVIRGIGAHQHGRPRSLELEVLDAGRPQRGSEGTGFGLTGLRERVQMHGGTAEIGPREPGPGWRVRVRFPLETPAGRAG